MMQPGPMARNMDDLELLWKIGKLVRPSREWGDRHPLLFKAGEDVPNPKPFLSISRVSES